ncbi:MAG: cytochrome c biogenesis protein ResB [Nitrospirota bacterium]
MNSQEDIVFEGKTNYVPNDISRPDPLEDNASNKKISNSFSKILSPLLDFFSSILLAISLFVLLAGASIIGTIIQQGEDPSKYIREYGERTYWWFHLFGLTDLYHNWWFTSLLVLLCVNSLACVYKRFPATWRSIINEKRDFSLKFVQNLKNHTQVTYNKSTGDAGRDIASLLSHKRYKVTVKESGDGIYLFATKGVWGRVGAHLAHISVMIILLGALIGGKLGYRNFGVILEGEQVFIPEGNFYVRLDKFWIDYYENGAVKDFYSKLTIIDDGKEALTKDIQVNDPLAYKGIWFYQASYGDAFDRIDRARVAIKEKKTDKVVGDFVLDWQKEYKVPDLNMSIRMVSFVSDFAYNKEKSEVYTKSVEHNNPAVRVEISNGDGSVFTPWLFYNYPDLYEMKESKYKFELLGYLPHKYTGLQVAKDPGVNIVWTGSGLLMSGLLLSLFVFHKRIWVKVHSDGDRAAIDIGGNTNKNHLDFEREYGKLINNIKEQSKEHKEK